MARIPALDDFLRVRVDLLHRNNPNALELLAMPGDCVRHRHPLFDQLDPALFLYKLCARTFGEYAM